MADNINSPPQPNEWAQISHVLSDGSLIAALTVMSYAAAFFYEHGFFSVFHCPTALIRIDWNTIIVVLGSIAFFFMILFMALEQFLFSLWSHLR